MVSLCKLMESLLFQRGGPDFSQDPSRLHSLIATTFVFCFTWTIGGNIEERQWDAFDTFAKALFDDHPDVKVSLVGGLFRHILVFNGTFVFFLVFCMYH